MENEQPGIFNCAQDDHGLSDFQKLPSLDQIGIPRVGIERFRVPLVFQHPFGLMNHDAEASMFVSLAGDKTGVNMSRLCAILQEEAAKPVDKAFLKKLLARYRTELRDCQNEAPVSRSEIALKFKYPVQQKSLKSGHWGWQYYDVEIRASADGRGLAVDLVLNYEYSSTCPCSLALAKQYEERFRKNRVADGIGVAAAHGQRSNALVTCRIDADCDFFLADLIKIMQKAIPTETQSLVKRVDELAFAMLNGENPMFVEHAARRISKCLEKEKAVLDWNAKVEHFESLHSHNAVATISKVVH